ncbi:MAG: hypothetical protein ABIW36_03950 [Terrimesophilobacter sp.]
MTESAPLSMIGDLDAATCVDGVCAIPPVAAPLSATDGSTSA